MSNPAVISIKETTHITDAEKLAIVAFRKAAGGARVTTCVEVSRCGLFLCGEAAETFGADLPCLAVYRDELGHWVALFRTRSGSLRVCQFLIGKEVL